MNPESPAPAPTPEQSPEVVPVSAEKKKQRSSRFNVLRLEKRITAAFSIMAKVFVIALISVALIFIARELSKDGYVITQVNVPASFEEAGYTGPVVAKRISENLSKIIRITRTEAIAEGYTPDSDENDVAVDMVGLGVPIRGVVELIGDALGINRKKKINADITVEGNTLALVIKIGNEPPERMETPMQADIGIPLKALIAEASETIFKYTNDRILALYFSNIIGDFEKASRLAKYQIEKYKEDPSRLALAYARWGSALAHQQKLEAALSKLEKAKSIDSVNSSIYTAWAAYYFELKDYQKALESSRKSYRLLPPGAPDFQVCTSLNNLGFYFSYNNQSDSALAYYEKVLAIDPHDPGVFYNISYEYLIKGDTSLCLDFVEKALSNGFNSTYTLTDPDMASLLNHPRFKEMMLKFEE